MGILQTSLMNGIGREAALRYGAAAARQFLDLMYSGDQGVSSRTRDIIRVTEARNRPVQIPLELQAALAAIIAWTHTTAQNTEADAPSEQNAARELDWLVARGPELEAHQGEWLLISAGRLIAHSPDFREIRSAIDQYHIAHPFVYYVPSPEEGNFIMV